MKARVKGTGEPLRFCLDDVEILPEGKDIKESKVPDYWEKLLHQYAGMAMQGMLSNDWCPDGQETLCVNKAVQLATTLVKKLKSESNEKTMH